MKNRILFYLALITINLSAISCSDDDDESCTADDDICQVVVTVCCTDNDCVYQVGDNEYATLDEAVQSSGCSTADRSPDELRSIVSRFEALTVSAKANL